MAFRFNAIAGKTRQNLTTWFVLLGDAVCCERSHRFTSIERTSTTLATAAHPKFDHKKSGTS